MSGLDVLGEWVVLLMFSNLFFWGGSVVVLLLGVVGIVVLFILKELLYVEIHYVDGFLLFIWYEVLAFFSGFVTCLWSESFVSGNLSHFLLLPIVGIFLLIGSSNTVTAVHHSMLLSGGYMHLIFTMCGGGGFVVLLLYSMYECRYCLISSVYFGACFCTDGLHFLHVNGIMGGLGLINPFGDLKLNDYYNNMIVWYWHFVVYIWLLVYIVVYLS
uniref:Cytochrome c oxidase subunit 3 n=1 Tax=Notocotylus intestinalis TaxID=1197314 RepID=A0A8A4JBI2_9TREM|nr:cytochrome c oxidase subunit III [Notocotylus intestinalis]QTC30696.1 cytochrome c oxidase subunit 3 [Notocotylus intestinalis]